MLKVIDINNLSVAKIITITVMILLCLVIILLACFLLLLSNYKNKQFSTFKNLQYIQNVNIKERLIRIKQMVVTNEQYAPMLGIWISRYHLFLKKDLKNLFKNYQQTIKLQKNKQYWKAAKLMKKVYHRSKTLKHQMQLLTTEIDYFISIDQLLREYQLFFKQNFNYLQDQTVKITLQNNLNEEQLQAVIKIINDMFNQLELVISDANLPKTISLLGEIALAVVTLAEIIANLPKLNYLVNDEIKEKMITLKAKCQTTNIDDSLLLQFQEFEVVIKEQLKLTINQINNLQYKKAKIQVSEILEKIAIFNSEINKEQTFYKIFKQNYTHFLTINFNFNEIYADINRQIIAITKTQQVVFNHEKVQDLATIINKQLSSFNHFDNLLIVESQKTIKSTSYHQLLMILNELFEHSILVFNSLREYNKLLNQQNKPKIKFEIIINKINSMMLQIDTILNNINYYYLIEKYDENFMVLQQLINDTIVKFKISDVNNQSLLVFNDIQNKIFQLYTSIKMEITIHKLSHATLVFANRHRAINFQIKSKFDDIETNMHNNHHHQALTLLLQLME
ncbi:hypothetical protein [Spiroplasma sp. AdecLV25b]|uniref:hypothetical protein n=1 Tax=Spiroplasma sp. AdecLV25b TaxID=3027162 RepID=UPI0027E0090D|nr:hypothetical protein [Spiroplasma sp. AdecLV25b]